MKRNIITESYKKLIHEGFGGDGWNDEVRETLNDVISNLESFIYEIRNCVKGAYTNAETHSALADYIRNLAEELTYAADEIENLPEDDEEEQIDESSDSNELPKDSNNIIVGDKQVTKPFKNKITDNEPVYVVMVNRKYVCPDQVTLTDDPNKAGRFLDFEAKDIMSNLKFKVLHMVDVNELFTDDVFDQDKANIYFKYTDLYESIQKKKSNKKLI